jgi:hypothetical protein
MTSFLFSQSILSDTARWREHRVRQQEWLYFEPKCRRVLAYVNVPLVLALLALAQRVATYNETFGILFTVDALNQLNARESNA